VLHRTPEDYSGNYQVENHRVLKKINALFATLAFKLGAQETTP